MAEAHRTLVDLVRDRAASHPERGYRFLGDGVSVTEAVTYADLDRDAKKIAVAMRERGIAPGDRVLLMYPPGLEFVRAFWACFYAGAIAVPVPPPVPARLTRTLGRLRAIAKDADASVVLVSDEHARSVAPLLDGAEELTSRRWLATDTVSADPTSWRDPGAKGDAIAVLQYTSGSTRDPRGVMLSHGNLLHNLGMLRGFHLDQEHMVMLHWLPLFHDMGLIRGMMSPLHMGGDCVMMSPMQFVQRPLKWLSGITTYRATTTGAPNFGFELCVRALTEPDLAKLDLSSLRVAFCSSEPIRKDTTERFIGRFAKCGFEREALRPAYGLAEATVMVSGEIGKGPSYVRVREADFRENRLVDADADTREHGGSVDLVSCGQPLGGQEVTIVDEQGRRCAPRHIGEVWIRGPSVGRGYWQKPLETRAVFEAYLADGAGPFLRTGDLGCFATAEGAPATCTAGLCITGRSSDLVILRGENYYPHEIEATVEAAVPELRAGCSAVFGVDHEGTSAVAMVCEYAPVNTTADPPWAAMIEAIRAAVSEEYDIAAHAICFVARGQTPKTASGKLQRSLARAMYLEDRYEVLHAWIARSRGGPSS